MGLDKIRNRIRSINIKSDKVIWILVMLFAMVSVLAIFSSSTFRANSAGVNKIVFFKRQLTFVLSGLGIMLLCYWIPLKLYRILAIAIYALSLIFLAIAVFKGEMINGAQRTIHLFGFDFQVLEFAKLGLIFYLAKAMEKWKDSLDTFKDYLLKLLLPIAVTCLCVLPNSASSVVLFGGLSMMILFFMGINWKYIVITIAAAAGALFLMVGIYNIAFKNSTTPKEEQGSIEKIFNRFGSSEHRIQSFLDDIKGKTYNPEDMSPEEYAQWVDDNRQSLNAKIAISEGGIIGKGPGKSTSRYSLSMAFSDFIYAFIVEEYGLLGGIFILFLYGWFLFRGIRIAQKCTTPFTQALSLGITWLVAIQAMLHIYVNVRMLPITGHTLPFISHGGTAFLMFSGAAGVLLSISRKVNLQNEEAAETAAKNTESTETEEENITEAYEETESDN